MSLSPELLQEFRSKQESGERNCNCNCIVVCRHVKMTDPGTCRNAAVFVFQISFSQQACGGCTAKSSGVAACSCVCRRVKMTRLRMRVAERLKGAQNTYAMLTTFNEVDMTGLMEMRNTYKVWRACGVFQYLTFILLSTYLHTKEVIQPTPQHPNIPLVAP